MEALAQPESLPPPIQPVQTFIVKTSEACNLGCPSCYEFEGLDASWRKMPRYMGETVLQATARRVGEHAAAHGLDRMLIVYHGGEPVLAHRNNPQFYEKARTAFLDAVPDACEVGFGLQTNATLLDRATLDVFRRLGIRIGVSLDGPRDVNDRNRPYLGGRGSYDDAVRGIRLLQYEYSDLFANLLCVVDVESDLLEVYRNLKAFRPPAIEFILPHANWNSPPPEYEEYRQPTVLRPHSNWLLPTKYADKLLPVFNEWYDDPDAPSIPLFEEIVRLGLGGPGTLEYIGSFVPDVLTVRTNGSIANVDTMSTTDEGMLELGLNVFRNTFNEALRHPAVHARQMGKAALADACQSCSLVDVCGGGYFVHRYERGSNPDEPNKALAPFKNRSVYCGDLTALIGGILKRVGELRPVGRGTNSRRSNAAYSELRHIVDRARLGHIDAQQAVRLAFAQGFVAAAGCRSQEGYEPCVAMTSSSKQGDDFVLDGWRPLLTNERGGKLRIVRASHIGKTTVWAALSGDVSVPDQRVKYGEQFLDPEAYDLGLLAWTYQKGLQDYNLYAHPDVVPVIRDWSPASIVGAVDFLKGDGFDIDIPDEPGHIASTLSHERIATFPVRGADAQRLLPSVSAGRMRYKPLSAR